MGVDDRLRIIYDESVRALNNQQAALTAIQSRASALVAAIAISTSFLGGVALEASGLTGWAIAALVCFVAAVALALTVIWPRSAYGFTHDVDHMLRAYVEGERSVDEMHRWLAIYNGRNWKRHRARLDGRWGVYNLFQLSVAALGLELIFWFIHLRG